MKERPAAIENTGRNTLGTQILTNKHLNSRQTTITLHNNSKHWHIKIKQNIHRVDFPESSKLCFSWHFYSAAGILSLEVDTNTGIPFSLFLFQMAIMWDTCIYIFVNDLLTIVCVSFEIQSFTVYCQKHWND